MRLIYIHLKEADVTGLQTRELRDCSSAKVHGMGVTTHRGIQQTCAACIEYGKLEGYMDYIGL